MFKSDEQVATFINLIEKFTLAVVNYHGSSNAQDAGILNKQRQNLELFVKLACGISPLSDTTDTLLCPDCGGEMALRSNRNNGQKFYGCRKFPACRGTRDEDGLSKADRDIKKYNEETAVQEGGFSFNRPKRDVVNEVAPPPEPVKTTWINPFAK